MVLASDAAQSPGEVLRRLADLERQVRELSAARGREAATIGAGGITVQDDGAIFVKDTTGKVIIWLGKVPFGAVTKPGMVAFRTDAEGGKVALSLFDGIFAVWDRHEPDAHIVMSTDEESGQGIATPWLNCGPMVPAYNTTDTLALLPKTASATFIGLWETDLALTHPKLQWRIYCDRDDGASQGEVRVVMDGTQIGNIITVTGGVHDIQTVSVPGWGDTVDYLQLAKIQVEARRTSGTGKIVPVPYRLFGRQS